MAAGLPELHSVATRSTFSETFSNQLVRAGLRYPLNILPTPVSGAKAHRINQRCRCSTFTSIAPGKIFRKNKNAFWNGLKANCETRLVEINVAPKDRKTAISHDRWQNHFMAMRTTRASSARRGANSGNSSACKIPARISRLSTLRGPGRAK